MGAPSQSLPDRKVKGTWPAPLALYLLLPLPPLTPRGLGYNSLPREVVYGPGTEYHVTIPRTLIGGLLGLGSGRECLVPYILLSAINSKF